MKLSNKALDDFKKLYFKKFGIKLTDEEANEKGLKLLRFYKILTSKGSNK